MMVAVKHTQDSVKNFWFKVPLELESCVRVGSEVICNTRRGLSKGYTVAVLSETFATQNSIFGNVCVEEGKIPLSLKELVAVKINVPIEQILIPEVFKHSVPSAYKIKKRILEYTKYGTFHTQVKFGAGDMKLRDGYTAYLVAKMLGVKLLTGFCYK